MVLEVLNSALCSNLRYNANLIYSILYKRDLFEQVYLLFDSTSNVKSADPQPSHVSRFDLECLFGKFLNN